MKIKGAFPVRWAPQDGTDGKNAIHLDLDNENDSILIDSTMNIIGTYPNTTARLYDGTTKVTSGITWSCVASGVEVEESVFTTTGEYNVEITKVTAKSGLSVTISAIYKGVAYKSIMTLTVLKGVDKYELVCTPNSVTYNTSTKTASEKDVKVQVYKTAQNSTRELLQTLPTGYSIKFVRSGQTSENIPSTSYANGYLTITNLLVDTYDYYTILLKDNNGKVLDSETVPILKGKDGADGAASIRLDLDNEFDSIIYSSSGKMLGSSVVTNIHVYEGEKEITGSVTSEIAVQIAGGSCIESTIKDDAGNKIGKKVTVDSISSDAEEAVVTVTLTHSGTVYTSVFTVKKLVGVDKYDLSVTPSAIAYNSTTKTASSNNMVILVYKTDANGVRTGLDSLTADGLTLEVKKTVSSTSSSVSVSYGTGGATISSLDMTASHYAITLKKGTAVMDTETVPINKSADGKNAIRLDLDNENDTMLYDDMGTLVSGNVTSQASLYDGGTKVTSGVTWKVTGTGCTADISTAGLVTVKAMSAKTGTCTVTATYNKVDYTSVLSLKKVVNGARYSIILSADSVQVNSSTGDYSPKSIKASFYRMGMDGVNSQMTGQDLLDYKVVVYDTDMEEEITYTSSGNDIVAAMANPVHAESTLVRITLYDRAGTEIIDYADIPIIYVSNGAKGDAGSAGNGIESHTISFAITTKPIAPDASSSDWVLSTASDCPKEGTKYKPYLWQKEAITYTQDTSLNKTIIRLVSVYNLDTRPQLLRQTAFDNEDAMDSWILKDYVGVLPDNVSANALLYKATETVSYTSLFRQLLFYPGKNSIIQAGKYYTLSFYVNTRIQINETKNGNNTGIYKIWLAAGSYKVEASFRLNISAADNGHAGYVKARYDSSYSSKDRTLYNYSSYDKRVSTATGNEFTVDADGEYEIIYGLYNASGGITTSDGITVNWIRIVPALRQWDFTVIAYLGGNYSADTESESFKDGTMLSSTNAQGLTTYYPIDDVEDDDGWARHWYAVKMKDDVNKWNNDDSNIALYQHVDFRVSKIPYLKIKQPKLEEGIMPTEWCEHKDDDTMQCSHNPCGTWSPVGTYYYCRGQRDVVKYYTGSNKSDMTWWRMKKRTSKAGYTNINPPYTDTAHWETSNKLKFTLVDTMFAEEIFTDKLTVGKLRTSNNNGYITLEGGLMKVYGNANAIPQIIIGADENGNAVLSIYDNNGGKVWDLSVNGLKGIDIIEMKMTEAKYYKVASHAQGASLTNTQLTAIVTAVTSGSELASYYQFSGKKQMNNGTVMAYYYGPYATTGTDTPSTYEGKYYDSSATNASILIPTGNVMATGLYTQKTKNHFMTMPDETTGISLYRCSLIRVNSGVFSAGNRYIEWKSDKSYIHLVDGAKEYTYGTL